MSAACRSCDAPIVWARTAAGRSMPLDAAPAIGGNVTVERDAAGKLTATVWPGPVAGGYVSHFTTCPHADEHRRDRAPRPSSTTPATFAPPARTPAPGTAPDRALALLERQIEQVGNSAMVPEALRGPQNRASLLLVALTGHTLGLTLAESVANLYVIANRVVPSVHLFAGRVRVRGHRFRTVPGAWTATECTIEGARADDPPEWLHTVTYTLDDARAAGLLDVKWKRWAQGSTGRYVAETWLEVGWDPVGETVVDNRGNAPAWITTRDASREWREPWYRQRPAMLYARALTRWVRAVCPEVLIGSLELGEDVDLYVPPDDDLVARVDGRDVIDVDQADDDLEGVPS